MATIEADSQSLVKKLVAIIKDLPAVQKEGRNPHFGYNYTKEGQIMALLGPRLASSGILVTTSVETMQPHYGAAKEGSYVSVTTLHKFIDTETGAFIEVRGAGVGWDSGDKGVYKAVTGAFKQIFMKNFWITDETDPEDETKKPEANTGKASSNGGQHRPTTAYEERTGEGDHNVATDLLELKAFLTENKVPEAFLIALLDSKGFKDAKDAKNVGQLLPGTLRRCLSPNSKQNLIKAWEAQKKGSKKKTEAEPKEEVRTNEGDQTVGRKFIAADKISPKDYLEQEGFDNWREVKVHFGTHRGKSLGSMGSKTLAGWMKWVARPHPKTGKFDTKDALLDAALCLAQAELGGAE
jgi:hypothetical protein